jgi:hypothetical protein
MAQFARVDEQIAAVATSRRPGEMSQLGRHPQVIQLARDLGLAVGSDSLEAIRDFALSQAARIVADSPIEIDSLEVFRRVVADKYGVRLEFIREHEDVARIGARLATFHPELGRRLDQEFVTGTTEGITLERDVLDHRRHRYLAVIDARGPRASRAYFTAWHEITHLVVHPEQLKFPGFRRTPVEVEIAKDPIESVVDHVAGHLGFFPTLFTPILEGSIRNHGFTFLALEMARNGIDPLPSLFSTAMASLRQVPWPAVLIEVDLAYKSAERRGLQSGQQSFDFVEPATAKLPAIKVVPNDLAREAGIAIRPNMRVPLNSVLHQAFEHPSEIDFTAVENQAWWEASVVGTLPLLRLSVHAARRGRYVYGLLALAS